MGPYWTVEAYYEILYYLRSAHCHPRAVGIGQLERTAHQQEPMLAIAIPQIIDDDLIQQRYPDIAAAHMFIVQMHLLQQDAPNIPLDLILRCLGELIGPTLKQLHAVYQ